MGRLKQFLIEEEEEEGKKEEGKICLHDSRDKLEKIKTDRLLQNWKYD